MKLYLSGPMNGKPDFNHPAFNSAAKALREMGHTVTNPAELDSEGDPLTFWRDFLKRDIPYVLQSDGVALLNGWWKSRGALLETYIAVLVGLDTFDAFTMEPTTDIVVRYFKHAPVNPAHVRSLIPVSA